jgi:MFS family permease
MGFEQMSWGDAVAYVQFMGAVGWLLMLSVPVGAVLAIRRGRRNRPGTTPVFPWFVVGGCIAALIAAIAYFLSGAWYGENGPSPQTAAAQVTVWMLVIVVVVGAIHAGLYLSTRPPRG